MTPPKQRRPASDLERDVLRALASCRLPPATSKKRFILDLAAAQNLPAPPGVTDREADYILFLGYYFRKQIETETVNRIFAEWFERPERLIGFSLPQALHQYRVLLDQRRPF